MPAPKRKPFDARRVPAEGEAILLAPDTITAVAVGGLEYQIETDGSVVVPAIHAAELVAHGLTIHAVRHA